MVPVFYKEIEEIPLSHNGKRNKKLLPKIELADIQEEVVYVAPNNEIEEKLVSIWEEMLSVEKVSVNSSFFDLGGSSLSAMRLIGNIRETFKVEIALKSIFEHSTVAALATLISGQEQGVQVSIPIAGRPDHLPLSFTQERLWIVDKLDGSIQYHLPALLRVSGALDLAVLSSSLRAVVARHESLRTIFYEEDGNAYQRIISAENFSITELSPALFDNGLVSKTTLSELLAIPFDLSSDYMIRASLLSLDSDDHVLLLEMHHIASDGWSIPLLVKELESIYSAQLLGEQANLPLLPIQYADYSLWQRNYLQGGLLESKLDYWVTHLDGVEVLSLPTDYPRPPVQQTDGSRHRFEIGSELTKELRSICHDQGATLFMVLLSMYKILLSKYS